MSNVVELRKLTRFDGKIADVIVVDSQNGAISSRNIVGIRQQERLALVYCERPSNDFPHEVRPLRHDFPITLHQNAVLKNEPTSLCLYFEPWSSLERTWTPQKHLKRILWWLYETSRNSLHRQDQSLERLYFQSLWQVSLPPNFNKNLSDAAIKMRLTLIRDYEDAQKAIRADYVYDANTLYNNLSALILDLSPVVQEPVQLFPFTLGELADQLASKGIKLIDALNDAIINNIPNSGINTVTLRENGFTFIFIRIPIKREIQAEPEFLDSVSFIMHENLAKLGLKTGVLYIDPDEKKKIYVDRNLLGTNPENVKYNEWQSIFIAPIETRQRISLIDAQIASGIIHETANFKGVLAGVGALGSRLAEIWARESWGNWTFIDKDTLMPHNVIRHIGDDSEIGMLKVDIMKERTEAIFTKGLMTCNAIYAKITDTENETVSQAITTADLLIDATTTLEVSRFLSLLDQAPRMGSVFITPSGLDAVLLLEDESRLTRLSMLETQYYRAILQEGWGKKHLT